jgi:hypothetical protein
MASPLSCKRLRHDLSPSDVRGITIEQRLLPSIDPAANTRQTCHAQKVEQ